uniref:Transglutaminase 2, like n=1 Tax=Nothobranchius pienaari TaxID=704102 RepID=A0A1A8N0X3_9TELE
MDICLQILDNSTKARDDSKRDIERRYDPVYISRIITAMVNVNDDNGVLEGRWDSPYYDGVVPVYWSGMAAIKEGNLGSDVKYDARFIFAEVNSDIVYWLVLPGNKKRMLSMDTRYVGAKISTKSIHGDMREDVTLSYKYPEGSEKERAVYERAGRRVTQPAEFSDDPVRLKLIIKHAKCVFGTDFDVIIEVKNEGGEEAQVKLTMRATAVTYNSLHRGDCHKQISNVTVPANQVHKQVLRLYYKDYARCVSEHYLIRVKVLAEVQGQNVPYMAVSNIHLSKPELSIRVGSPKPRLV